MDDKIMVSVSCLVYNHEKYLRDCLEGFVNQKTNFKFEVLIHDDASTDHSADIIREYEEKYPELIKPIYQKENQYSQGIRISPTYQYPRAKGKYIALCEGDDYWTDPYKLQKQFDALENNPSCAFCVHKVDCFHCSTGEHIQFFPRHKYPTGIIQSPDFMRQILTECSFQTSSYFGTLEGFIKKDSFDFVKKSPTGDTGILLYFGSQYDVYYIDEAMSRYREFSENSWTITQQSNDLIRIASIEKRIASLESFDDFTEHKFHDLCAHEIRTLNYTVACLSKDYRSMLKYKDLIKKDGIKTIIFCYMNILFPKTTKKIWARKSRK